VGNVAKQRRSALELNTQTRKSVYHACRLTIAYAITRALAIRDGTSSCAKASPAIASAAEKAVP